MAVVLKFQQNLRAPPESQSTSPRKQFIPMGQIRHIAGQYYIEFYARGLLYSQLGGNTKAEAMALLDKVESSIARGEALTVVRDIPIIDFQQRFLDKLKTEVSPRTFKRFVDFVYNLQLYITTVSPQTALLSQITPRFIETYKNYLKQRCKVKLVNFSLLLLAEFLNEGINAGFINDNPTIHVKLLPWPINQRARSYKAQQVQGYFKQQLSIIKITQSLKLTDVARLMYFSNFIPTQREDVYN